MAHLPSFKDTSEVLEAAAHPAGLLRGIAARRAFKSIEKVQAAARRFLIQHRYPSLLDYHPSLSVPQHVASTPVIVPTQEPEPIPVPPEEPSSPPIDETSQSPTPSILPTTSPKYDGPEHTLIRLMTQITTTRKESVGMEKQIQQVQNEILDWKNRVQDKEQLIATRELFIGDDCVPLRRFEQREEEVLELQRELEASIAREAAAKGQLLQIRGKVQTRAKWHQWHRNKNESSSLSPLEAERSMRDAILRAQLFLEATMRKAEQPVKYPPRDPPSETCIKLNRTRRSPFAPKKPPLPKVLTREQLRNASGDASSSSSLPRPSHARKPTGHASVPPSAFSNRMNSSDKRHSMPIPDTTFQQDREAINQRLAAFYKPLVATNGQSEPRAPPSSRTPSSSTPNLPKTSSGALPSRPPLPFSTPRTKANNRSPGVDSQEVLPSWVDEILDHLAHPSASDGPNTSPELRLQLELPAPSPTRGEWDLIDPEESESLLGSRSNLPLPSHAPSSSTAKLRKRASFILAAKRGELVVSDEGNGQVRVPNGVPSSSASSASSSSGWLKAMTHKVTNHQERRKKSSALSHG